PPVVMTVAGVIAHGSDDAVASVSSFVHAMPMAVARVAEFDAAPMKSHLALPAGLPMTEAWVASIEAPEPAVVLPLVNSLPQVEEPVAESGESVEEARDEPAAEADAHLDLTVDEAFASESNTQIE